MFSTILKFNHNHSARGHVSPRTGRPDGGKFTTQYEQEVDARTGKPKYDKNGKAIHARDKDGNKIPKSPGEYGLSESHDSQHDNSKRTKPKNGTGRDAAATARIKDQLDRMLGLLQESASVKGHEAPHTPIRGSGDVFMGAVQAQGVQKVTSNLPNVDGTYKPVFLLASETQSRRTGKDKGNGEPPLDISTPTCPSEAKFIAALSGQLTRQTTNHFESNSEGGTVQVSKKQPEKQMMLELTKESVEAKAKEAGLDPLKYLQKSVEEHFANRGIKPPVIAETPNGYGVNFSMVNSKYDKLSSKEVGAAKAAQYAVDDFAKAHTLTRPVKHWNGVSSNISVKDGKKACEDFAKAHPNHPGVAIWRELAGNSNTTVSPTLGQRVQATTDFQAAHKADLSKLLTLPTIKVGESYTAYIARLKPLGFTEQDAEDHFDLAYPITQSYYTNTTMSAVGDPIYDDISKSDITGTYRHILKTEFMV